MPPRRPRVVILVENLPVPLDRRVWLEATILRDAGWDVVVIGPRGGPGMDRLRDEIDGVTVLRYPQRVAEGLSGYLAEYLGSLVFSASWFIWARLRGPIDVIHGCNPPDLFWLFGWVGRLWGATYVFDQHDPSPELSLTKFGSRGVAGRLAHRFTLAIERASYRTASVVFSVNESCRDIALRRGRLSSDRVVVLRNTPDVATLRALVTGIRPIGRGVGYVGVMGSQDGLDVLIDAWARVVAEPDLSDVRLDLVGDGPMRAALQARVAGDRSLASSVRFHGFQPPSAYAPLLAACMIGVSPDPPTPFNDLSSMVKIMDYLAIGRGVVAFDLTETRRLGGEALVLARPATPDGLADALIGVLRDPAEAARLEQVARARIDSLTQEWEPFGTTLVREYERVRPRRT